MLDFIKTKYQFINIDYKLFSNINTQIIYLIIYYLLYVKLFLLPIFIIKITNFFSL